MRIARAVSSFSLLLLLLASVFASSADLSKAIQAEPPGNALSPELRRALLQEARQHERGEYRRALDDLLAFPSATNRKRVVDLIEARERAATPVRDADRAKAAAARIKANPLYRESNERQESNWLYNALERFARLFRFQRPDVDVPTPNPGWMQGLIYVAWGLLGLLLLVFAWFAVRHFRWRRKQSRKAKAVLEEDEPERTLDEWLELADRYAAEGKVREAVRCLYLSCLLKFDERGIARFVRGETNWEHLRRIESSPRKPDGLDFRTATQHFDRVWYGFHVRGTIDIEEFRAMYQALNERLRVAA